MDFKEERYPPQIQLTGEAILLISKGVQEFKNRYADQYDLLRYEIWLNKFEEKRYFCVPSSPIPKLRMQKQSLRLLTAEHIGMARVSIFSFLLTIIHY